MPSLCSLNSIFCIFLTFSGTFAKEPPPSSIIETEWFETPPVTNLKLKDLPPPFKTRSARKPAIVIDVPKHPVLQVPRFFQVNIFAANLSKPRWLQLTPGGDVLVTETYENRIRLLKDINGDGVADNITTFADASNGLNIPFGMAFAPEDGYFFLGNSDEVRRYDYKNNQDKLEGTGTKILDLPSTGNFNQHWTRNVAVSPKEKRIFISIGSHENLDEEDLPRASVQWANFDGSNPETFAYGLRNPNGLDFHPMTNDLYTTVNERDELGDDLVPDYFTKLQKDDFYGWPYAYLSPNLTDPRLQGKGSPELIAKTKTPDVLFQSHSAPLGMKFYNKTQFPAHYQNGAFVAFRGSWNRNQGTGYKIVYVPFGSDFRPLGNYEDFVTGFLTDPSGPKTWGRPVGLLVMPDGSLLFTEEANGRIYRVEYIGTDGMTSDASINKLSPMTVELRAENTTISTLTRNLQQNRTYQKRKQGLKQKRRHRQWLKWHQQQQVLRRQQQ